MALQVKKRFGRKLSILLDNAFFARGLLNICLEAARRSCPQPRGTAFNNQWLAHWKKPSESIISPFGLAPIVGNVVQPPRCPIPFLTCPALPDTSCTIHLNPP